MPFPVGSMLRVINVDGVGSIKLDEVYEKEGVHGVYPDLIKVKGKRAYFSEARFELVPALVAEPVAEPVAPPPIPDAIPQFAVGDKVHIVAKVQVRDHGPHANRRNCHWDMNGAMEAALNNGVAYEVAGKEEKDVYRVKSPGRNGGWFYLAECLALAAQIAPEPVVEAVKAVAKKVVKEKPPVPDLRQEMMKKWEVKDGKEQGIGSICSYAVQFEDGTIRYQKNDVCHYRLRAYDRYGDDDGKKKQKVFSAALSLWRIVDGDLKDKKQLDAWKAYANYIINESPWSVAFHKASVEDAMRDGLLLDVSKPLDWCAGAAIALREGTEFEAKLPMFKKMLDLGYSGDVAYIMSEAFQLKPAQKHQYISTGFGGGHHALSGSMDFDVIFNFFANGYKLQGQKPYSEYSENYKICGAIGEEYAARGRQVTDWLDNNTKKKVEGVGFKAVKIISEFGLLDVAEKIAAIINEKKEAK